MSVAYEAKRLREKRGEIAKKIQEFGTRVRAADRPFTPSEREEFEKLKTDWEITGTSLRTVEDSLSGSGRSLGGSFGFDVDHRPGKRAGRDGGPAVDPEVRALAFQAWARSQYGRGLKSRHKEACRLTRTDPRSKWFNFRLSPTQTQARAMSVGATTAGGYTVPQDFSGALERQLVAFGGVREAADVIRTDTAADMPYPTVNDTTNAGEILGEGAEAAFADPTFSSVTFKGWKYSSKGILISNELLADSAFAMERIIGEMIGERIGRAQGPHFTTGTGTSQPKGIVTCATAGKTTAGGTAITAAELTLLKHSVDPAYRTGPKFGFMMHDGVLAYLMTVVDGNGLPIYRPDFRSPTTNGPMIDGVPVWINQHMQSTVATATKTVLCGDFSKFKVRDAGVVRVRRLDERYAEKDQVGFIGFLRSDSNCVNTSAIKYLLQA